LTTGRATSEEWSSLSLPCRCHVSAFNASNQPLSCPLPSPSSAEPTGAGGKQWRLWIEIGLPNASNAWQEALLPAAPAVTPWPWTAGVTRVPHFSGPTPPDFSLQPGEREAAWSLDSWSSPDKHHQATSKSNPTSTTADCTISHHTDEISRGKPLNPRTSQIIQISIPCK